MDERLSHTQRNSVYILLDRVVDRFVFLSTFLKAEAKGQGKKGPTYLLS